MEDRGRALHLSRHLSFCLGQQGLLVFLVIAPQDKADDDRQRQQGPADRSRDTAYPLAEQVTARSEYRRTDNSVGGIEDEEPPGR
jgi:hypothetical protein